MKNNTKHIKIGLLKPLECIILLLIAISFSNDVYGQDNNLNLIGSWTLDYNPSVNKMSPNLKEHFNAMAIAKKDKIKKAYQGRTFSFYDNGSYLQTLADKRSITGSWTLLDKVLQMTDKKGGVLNFRVLSFTNSTLVIKAIENGQSKLFLSQWYLTKTKTN